MHFMPNVTDEAGAQAGVPRACLSHEACQPSELPPAAVSVFERGSVRARGSEELEWARAEPRGWLALISSWDWGGQG